MAAETAYREGRPEFLSRVWWGRLWDSYYLAAKDLFTDGGMLWASAVAFYAFLSIFPLLLVAVTIASFFVEPGWVIEQITRIMGELLPQGEEEIEQVIAEAYAARGGAGLASILVLLWSGTRVFGSLTTALNISFDVRETYSMARRLMIEGLHLVTLGLFFVAAVSSRLLLHWLWERLELAGDEAAFIMTIMPGLISGLLLIAAFFLIYRFVPRRRPSWQPALVGAVTATLLFVAARPLFLTYIVEFSDYNLIYGSVALVVILVFWVWVVAMILLFGAEVASHVEALLMKGLTPEEVRRRHRKRSPIKSEPGHDPDQESNDQPLSEEAEEKS